MALAPLIRVRVCASQVLMTHQLSGVRWLFAAFGRGGGLLTDEPGLGKTLQVIVLLEALVRAGRVTRALIAAPANLCARLSLQRIRALVMPSTQPCRLASRAGAARIPACPLWHPDMHTCISLWHPDMHTCIPLMASGHTCIPLMASGYRTARARTLARRVANWESEFHRWLGSTSSELSVFTVARAAANLAATVKLQELVGTSRPNHMVLICGYEALYTNGRALCTGAGVDLLVADESHVLASDGARAKVVRSVPAGARLLLTGTPLSNNLLELYQLYDLARPGVLGREVHFRADFVAPIHASSEEGACLTTKAVGRVASARLAAVAAEMQLGRKGGEVERGLFPRHDLLIMCRPTGLQRQLVALCNPRSTDGVHTTKGAALVCLAAINTALLDPAVRPLPHRSPRSQASPCSHTTLSCSPVCMRVCRSWSRRGTAA